MRGPVKLPAHLEQKTNPSRKNFYADLHPPRLGESFSVLKLRLRKKGRILIIILAEKRGAMAPVAPPVPTPMAEIIEKLKTTSKRYLDVLQTFYFPYALGLIMVTKVTKSGNNSFYSNSLFRKYIFFNLRKKFRR